MNKSLLLIFLIGCMPVNQAFFTPYIIPAGQNYSIPRTDMPLSDNIIYWQFRTNDSWDFEQDNSGLNKIGGIYWGSNHINSARLCFQSWKGNRWLWYYCYENGVSPQQDKRLKGKLLKIDSFGKTYDVITGWSGGYFVIAVNDTIVKIETDYRADKDISPRGFATPYIGGSFTINKNWIVPIKLK